MNYDEKFEFHLSRIEKKVGKRSRLNTHEMLLCIEKSRSFLNRVLDRNELHRIPKICSEIVYERQGKEYVVREFDIIDVALFLANTQGE
jgi:hypothetical protein